MRVGVLGAGQLGRMLAIAGYPLGLHFRFLDPNAHSPAGELAELIVANYDDDEALARLVEQTDVVTFEFENVPAHAAEWLADHVRIYPPPLALEKAQDRVVEKLFFQECGLPVPAWFPIDSQDDLEKAAETLGLPSVLKTRREGYDGKGQVVLRAREDVETAWNQIDQKPAVLESFVTFERELSIIAVRGRNGECRFYPLVQNEHRGGILYRSIAPAPNLIPPLQKSAESHARSLLERLDYVGVLTIEFFEKEGKLLANEMAPRVHNSGHWSIEGAETSQFANHVRAVCGMALGSTTPRGSSGMLNIVGALPVRDEILKIPGAHLHLYNKEPRPGRKIGHVTVIADSFGELEERMGEVEGILDWRV